MKQTCGAPTKDGGTCGSGLGCHHHRDHCKQVIRARAQARITASAPIPVQGEFFPATWDQVQKIISANIPIGRDEIRPASICGCEG